MKPSDLQKLLTGEEIEPVAERRVIEMLLETDPRLVPKVWHVTANQRRHLREALRRAEESLAESEATLERVRRPPWRPGVVLRTYADGTVDVDAAGQRRIVRLLEETTDLSLVPGDEVLLDPDSWVIVARSEGTTRTGCVRLVSRTEGQRVFLQGAGDEEDCVMCAPDLAASLQAGDEVLVARGFPCIIERLTAAARSPHLLAETPAVRFEDIGGLDGIAAEICRDLDLRLLYRDRVRAFGLRPLRGITLVGPPGVGKTMLAQAMASYLARVQPATRFFHVKPGCLRGIYYGQTEARIRELFASARSTSELAVIFFDELDSFGTRGLGVGQDIDGRVLGALLAEIDGLGSSSHVLCVGATNRLDLCDAALVREGRFGDRIYSIPRPGREATRQILSRYLRPGLPYAVHDQTVGEASALIESATAYLYSPHGGAGPIATLIRINGEPQEIRAPAVLSGALIATAVERAKHAAAQRSLEGGSGLSEEDLLTAFDEALDTEAKKLCALHVARQLLGEESVEEIVRVQIPPERRIRLHRVLRAA